MPTRPAQFTVRRVVLRSENVVINAAEYIIAAADVFVLEVNTMVIFRVHVEDLDMSRDDFMAVVGLDIFTGYDDMALVLDDVPVGVTMAAISHCVNLLYDIRESELL